MNPANTVFKVPVAGRYFISYNVNMVAGSFLTTSILFNGVEITASKLESITSYSANVILNLAANDTISLEVAGRSIMVTLQDGAGASLSVIRVS